MMPATKKWNFSRHFLPPWGGVSASWLTQDTFKARRYPYSLLVRPSWVLSTYCSSRNLFSTFLSITYMILSKGVQRGGAMVLGPPPFWTFCLEFLKDSIFSQCSPLPLFSPPSFFQFLCTPLILSQQFARSHSFRHISSCVEKCFIVFTQSIRISYLHWLRSRTMNNIFLGGS